MDAGPRLRASRLFRRFTEYREEYYSGFAIKRRILDVLKLTQHFNFVSHGKYGRWHLSSNQKIETFSPDGDKLCFVLPTWDITLSKKDII